MTARRIALFALGLSIAAPGVHAQSLRDRIDAVRLKRGAETQTAPAAPTTPGLETLLARPTSMHFDGNTFDQTLRAWSQSTGIGLLINRPAWENLGVDLTTPITVQLDEVPAAQALLILLDLGSDTFDFIAQPSPGSRAGLEILTKQEANRTAYVRVYEVRDLVMEVPSFTDAPSMNLSDVLSGDVGGGGAGIFEDADEPDEPSTMQERGDALAETIRQTVEPTLWRENGGDVATVRFRNGQLIVRAPGYVHAQIAGDPLQGRPGLTTQRPLRASSADAVSMSDSSPMEPADTGGVSGVAPSPQDVASVAE